MCVQKRVMCGQTETSYHCGSRQRFFLCIRTENFDAVRNADLFTDIYVCICVYQGGIQLRKNYMVSGACAINSDLIADRLLSPAMEHVPLYTGSKHTAFSEVAF